MSSLMASQSTLCLQTRQDAVANDPEITELLMAFQHCHEQNFIENKQDPRLAVSLTMTLDNPLNSSHLF